MKKKSDKFAELWNEFLNIRANLLDVLSARHSDYEIAEILSMDETQVMLIRTRAINNDGTPRSKK